MVICDEISTKEEVEAARTMGQRGVRIIASVYFSFIFFILFLVGDGGDAHYGAAGCSYHRFGVLFVFCFFLVGDGGDAHYGAAGCPYCRLGVFFLFIVFAKMYYTDTEHCTLCRFRV